MFYLRDGAVGKVNGHVQQRDGQGGGAGLKRHRKLPEALVLLEVGLVAVAAVAGHVLLLLALVREMVDVRIHVDDLKMTKTR